MTQMQAFVAKAPPLVADEDGVIRVAGTRVQLETIVVAFDAGATAEEIAQQYTSLDLADVGAGRRRVIRLLADENFNGDILRGSSDGSRGSMCLGFKTCSSVAQMTPRSWNGQRRNGA